MQKGVDALYPIPIDIEQTVSHVAWREMIVIFIRGRIAWKATSGWQKRPGNAAMAVSSLPERLMTMDLDVTE
jgi:outer membrane protease